MREIKFLTLFIFITLVFSTVIVAGFNHKISNAEIKTFDERLNDDFYFVHLTDTHIRHKIFDRNEDTSSRLKTVVETVVSFENKPAFIVITGDLTEWAAGITGALNSMTFTKCFFEKDEQFYADEEFTIPVYTTPGNHDYVLHRNLRNYHRFIDKKHVTDEDRYIVTHEDVSLFFMDSGPNYYSDLSILFEWHGEGLYDCDIEWLEEELSNCESTRKIILMHHPAVGEEDDLFIHNREEFVELCETYEVEVVLAGHTHKSRVYDYYLNEYTEEPPLNCSLYPTLYVQSDDCKQGVHFRNISIQGNDIWIEPSENVKYENSHLKHRDSQVMWRLFNKLSSLFRERHT
jgi:3',5'-cyclic AMP phosphodiesterase CpdA